VAHGLIRAPAHGAADQVDRVQRRVGIAGGEHQVVAVGRGRHTRQIGTNLHRVDFVAGSGVENFEHSSITIGHPQPTVNCSRHADRRTANPHR
jgi:hypothetical protein